MAALIAVGQPEQLPFHANRAMDNGLTSSEASEVLTHVAFYSGWPRAMSAVPVLRQALEKRKGTQMSAPQANITITPAGSGAALAPEEYFTGGVQISGRYQSDAPARIGGATVSFSAGARTGLAHTSSRANPVHRERAAGSRRRVSQFSVSSRRRGLDPTADPALAWRLK